MTDFKQDEHETPVLFRVHRAPKKYGGEVTAVFPCEPWDTLGQYMTCYAHIGQHSSCDFSWYQKTRPATETEYSDLKRELEGPPYGYRLKVYQRMQPAHREKLRKAARALRADQ